MNKNKISSIRPKAWPLIEKCVEDGIRYGFRRINKHQIRLKPDIEDKPGDVEQIIEELTDYIMNEISEWFIFDDYEEV